MSSSQHLNILYYEKEKHSMNRRTLFVLCLLAVLVISGGKTASACWGYARPSTTYYVSASPCYYSVPACWSYCCNPCCNRVYYYDPCTGCCSYGWTQAAVTGSQAATSGCSNCKPAANVKPGAKLQPTPQPSAGGHP